jgi:FkbM family methyltransferase
MPFISKSAIGHLICNPIAGRVFKSARPRMRRGGIMIDLSSQVVSARMAAALSFGLIERAERALVRTTLGPRVPVIELGSGLGSITMSIAERLDPQTPMLLVEANPRLSSWWKQNLRESARPNVGFLNVACAITERGVVTMAIDDDVLGSATDSSGSGGVDVEARSISEICRDSGFDRFSLVCDIEGEEFSLLRDAGADVFHRCDAVVMEVHPDSTRKTEDLLKLFERYGLFQVGSRAQVIALQRKGVH